MEPDVIQIAPYVVKEEDFGPQLIILKSTNNVKELQTYLRDKTTSRSDFIFYADRLIRLVVEEGLNLLPYQKCKVTTPTGHEYEGLKYEKGNCGVSIIRSGEAMEQGLQNCCGPIRIGKILIQSDADTHEAKVLYSNFPPEFSSRKILLMYPIMSTGNTVTKAMNVLKNHKVKEKSVILLNLFCTPRGEAMEQGLQNCCGPIRIGKILIQSDADTHEAKVLYSNFPPEFSSRKILLMYPIMSTGNTVTKAMNVLKNHKVKEKSVILLNLFCTPRAVKSLISSFPGISIVTTEVHPVAPNHFGQKYFGTE